MIPPGITHIGKRLPSILEDAENDLPGPFRRLVQRLGGHLKVLDRQVEELEHEIKAWPRQNETRRKWEKIPGIGPITASALVASIGDAKSVENGRQMAAFLGLVPRQHSSGGKPTLLGISKRGDVYLRTLLIHGARAVVRVAERKTETAPWLKQLLARGHKNVATVAAAQQERAHRLGAARAGTRLPVELRPTRERRVMALNELKQV